MKKDYYSILGVTKDSTLTEIKAAYRKLALKFHPDKNPGDPFFEKMFLEVKEAYDALTALHSKKEENSKSASNQEVKVDLGPDKIDVFGIYTIKITVSNEKIKSYGQFPEIGGFQKLDVSQSSSMNIINGQMNSSTTITQNYKPFQKGQFVLEKFSISINDKNYSFPGKQIYVVDRAETSSKSAESQSKNSQFDASQLIDKIIKELKDLEGRVENKSKNQLKTEVIFDYISKILGEDLIKIVRAAHPQKREQIIFAMVPLLRFFSNSERESLLLKIISIAGADNTLISQIDVKNKESVRTQISIERKQAVLGITKKIFEYRLIIIASIFFGWILYMSYEVNSGDSSYSDSRDVIVDDEPEVSQKISKWVGNKLNTGDSPYNNYFGTGVYDNQFSNEVTIHNGQKTDVIVCLTEYENPYRTIRNEYIRAGESFKLTSVPNGLYSLKWFYGNNWNPDTLYMDGIQGFFDNDSGFSKSDSPSDLLKMEQNDKQYSTYEITLYSVQNGNMETKEINPNEFFKKN